MRSALFAGGSRRGWRAEGQARDPSTHESLEVYQRAIEFLAMAFVIAERVPRRHEMLADQLRRAAMSIPLNVAEGHRKPDGGDRGRLYAIARGSAVECAAILAIVRLLPEGNAAPLSEGKDLLMQVVALLQK